MIPSGAYGALGLVVVPPYLVILSNDASYLTVFSASYPYATVGSGVSASALFGGSYASGRPSGAAVRPGNPSNFHVALLASRVVWEVTISGAGVLSTVGGAPRFSVPADAWGITDSGSLLCVSLTDSGSRTTVVCHDSTTYAHLVTVTSPVTSAVGTAARGLVFSRDGSRLLVTQAGFTSGVVGGVEVFDVSALVAAGPSPSTSVTPVATWAFSGIVQPTDIREFEGGFLIASGAQGWGAAGAVVKVSFAAPYSTHPTSATTLYTTSATSVKLFGLYIGVGGTVFTATYVSGGVARGVSLTYGGCVPGYATSSTLAAVCAPCSAGTFSSTNDASTCQSCSAATGAYCPPLSTSGSPGLGCPAGYRCLGATLDKLICGVGQFSEGGAGTCTSCPAGTYSSVSGATACTPCPSGTYGSGTGLSSSACTAPCPSGQYSLGAATSCSNVGDFAPYTIGTGLDGAAAVDIADVGA